MSKVLFVVPPQRATSALVAQLYPMPLGQVQLATVVQAAGHEVFIKDFLAAPWAAQASSCTRPPSFEGRHAPGYRHYGAPLDECEAWLQENLHKYDVICLASCQCTTMDTVVALARMCRRHAPGLPLIMGGPWASTDTTECARLCAPDVIVRGEAELDIVAAIEGRWPMLHRVIAVEVDPRVGGLGSKRFRDVRCWKGRALTATALNKLPPPDWRLAPPQNYPRYNGRVRAVTFISRGCPQRCTFCSVHTLVGYKYRRMSAARIERQLRHMVLECGVQYVCFMDDNLFLTVQAVDQLLDIIQHLRATVPAFKRVRYYMEEGLEVRMAAKPGVVHRIAAAGFDNISLGLETMNNATRVRARKPYGNAELKAAVAEFEAAGVQARALYVLGLPGDTLESICADVVAFSRLGMEARPNNLQLYPGTECTKLFMDNGWVQADYDYRLSSFYTPDRPGLRFEDIRHVKQYLGAVSMAVTQLGVNPFYDSWPAIHAQMLAKRYKLESGGGGLAISGNMWRKSPWRRLAELLQLRQGSAGVITAVVGEAVHAHPDNKPLHAAQAAMQAAMQAAGVTKKGRR